MTKMNRRHIDAIYTELLSRSSKISAKDGSLGLDVLSSLHQYHRAYLALQDNLAIGSRVLDWGGGSGHFSFFLHQNGYQTDIFSFNQPNFVDQEIRENKITHTLADPMEPSVLPYADQSFDAVCSIGVLEHVREIGGDELASLKEIQRILKPGGVFICYHLPNQHSWIEWLAKRFGSYHHQYTFNKPQIRRLFNRLLEIQLCERYAILPRNSLRRLPRAITNNRTFAYFFDAVDAALSALVPRIHQNWLVIAKKPLA
jgi:ubiquinone/menaquinone biosynthesis C-methylase UbiE